MQNLMFWTLIRPSKIHFEVIKIKSLHSWDAEIWFMTLGFGWKWHPWPPQPPTERVPKIHKRVDFWWSISHWEIRIGHFVARLIATSCSVRFLMIWGCWGHWGQWGCWGHWGWWCSWLQENHPVIKVQAAFDFLRPKRLLRSLRPVMLSCLLRLLRSLRFSKPLKPFKSIT